jgi:aspartate/methionine/tyrosine aminotransferase
MIDMPQIVEQVLHVNSFSKTYAMTGWRLGYIVAPRALLAPILTIHTNMMSQVHWPSQRAGIAALTGPQDSVERMRIGYERRRRPLIDALRLIPNGYVPEPQGAFYAFYRFDSALGLTSADAVRRLLEAGVAVRSGSEFGRAGEGWLRVTFAAALPEIEHGVEIIRATFESLTAGSAPALTAAKRGGPSATRGRTWSTNATGR